MIEAIYLSDAAGGGMTAVPEVLVTPDGLAGDRYAAGAGTFSGRYPHDGRAVSLIDTKAAADFPDGTHRRNLVTRGVDLPALVGRTFRVGGATLRGVRPCPPCGRLDRLTGRDARRLLHRRGGLRCDVVTPGPVRVGDVIEAMG